MAFRRNAVTLVVLVAICHPAVRPCHGFVPSSPRSAVSQRSRTSIADGIGVGIDLGTTNSAIAILEGNEPKIVEIPGNGRTIKSVVAFDEAGKALVGNEALDWEQKTNINAYRHVKRVIGTGINFLSKDTKEVVPHLVDSSSSSSGKGRGKSKKKKPTLEKLLQDAEENPTRLYSLHKGENGSYQSLAPEEISSEILRYLLDVATDHTKQPITRAVIGVPAYFNDAQREATILAANMAGIEKVKLLREPEAAALAYGVDKDSQEEELVLVFDLGGGTYDVSVLLVDKGLTEIVCTSGDAQLGGSDFDARIAKRISGIVKNCCHSEECSDMMVRAAECIRIYLSNNKQVNLALPLSEAGWVNLGDPGSVIMDEAADFEPGSTTSTHAFVQWSRKNVESFCLNEILKLVRPIREVAIMAGAMLPGDARPSAVESALEIDQAFDQAEAFYPGDEEVPQEVQQQAARLDFKAAKKAQQKGRKKARQLAKEERKYRSEAKKAAETASSAADTRVSGDGISGRPLKRVVLVGGATRMPAIGRLLSALTGCTPQKTVDPDEAVALGCAVHVGILDGNEEMGTVLNPMQAAILRAVVEQQQRDGVIDDGFFDDDDEFGEYEEIEIL
eukprot:CAMPEP_0176005632 /NCGR_PEP_ID=MMETSP0120_2-20121206/2306_1 /TAXON_ID=160619 /ORGANISM="Kryptoperidinium foliaceum, Strain CCMP 1326" /LENGTH=617 /DNA_ID=CAMNT_0017338345 /DNA_START=34 /DNA_END=1887 /DNA_ORIENTATION=-